MTRGLTPDLLGPGVRSVDALLMRGGTSRGLFVAAADLPDAPSDRDEMILRLLGRRDTLQVDGVGGGNPSTSKLVSVSPSSESEVDLDYLYAGVVPGTDRVTTEGNCGNLTAAVTTYGLLTGLLEGQGDTGHFVLRNHNTGGRVVVRQRLVHGWPVLDGSFHMDGVDGTGAEVTTTYVDPAGGTLGALLPTSCLVEPVPVPGLGDVDVSIVDVTSGYAFVDARDLGLTGHERPNELNARPDVLAQLEAVRGACAARLDLVADPAQASRQSPGTPRLALVTRTAEADPGHLTVRAFAGGRVHHAMSVTGAMCAAAAALLPETVVSRVASAADPPEPVEVAHPKGVIPVTVDITTTTAGPRVIGTTVSRTVRVLMAGRAYL